MYPVLNVKSNMVESDTRHILWAAFWCKLETVHMCSHGSVYVRLAQKILYVHFDWALVYIYSKCD